jgi:hypothetical protein
VDGGANREAGNVGLMMKRKVKGDRAEGKKPDTGFLELLSDHTFQKIFALCTRPDVFEVSDIRLNGPGL